MLRQTITRLYLLLFCIFCIKCNASADLPPEATPVSYKGRIIPLESYAKQYLQEFYGKPHIKKNHLNAFHQIEGSALDFFQKLYFYGHEQFDHSPLFHIHYAGVKKALGLNLKENHFSYEEITKAIYENEESSLNVMRLIITYHFAKNALEMQAHKKSFKTELKALTPGLFVTLDKENLIVAEVPDFKPWHFLKKKMILQENVKDNLTTIEREIKHDAEELLNLLALMNQYKNLKGISQKQNEIYEKKFLKMQESGTSSKEIAILLENEHPLQSRLNGSGSLIYSIPSKKNGVFYPIDSLDLKTYDLKTNSLKPINNFTIYSDTSFQKIQAAYGALKKSVLNNEHLNIQTSFVKLENALNEAYAEIEGSVAKEAHQKTLYYPASGQLKAELLYQRLPLIEASILCYLIALIGLIISRILTQRSLKLLSLIFLSFGLIFHTAILGLRCYILNRPPVSNMFETVIYVPWIALIAGFIFYYFNKNSLLLIASCFCSIVLLIVLKVAGMNSHFENVQAVLDSNYWLTVHVLLIVGSYGVFFLCGVLGQIYLGYSFFNKKETEEMKFLANLILQTMYTGVFMLIPGTILGGVWAAESWGRFWDWDPKESWAFISSCIYLIVIHGYRFHKISGFGLAFGSCFGLMAISFTWYGVNYILGTGLHSYGFGSGKDLYYYLFLLIQLFFLIIILYKHQKRLEIKCKNML